jgi:double-stranded uracil-DNA glycosylase
LGVQGVVGGALPHPGSSPTVASTRCQGVSHRVTEQWMGKRVETLEDLLRPGLRAVCVGINPALRSVEAGHYYQGRLGQQFYERLRRSGLLPPRTHGWEDDLAFERGVGFTDIVKRPTAKAAEVTVEEFEHGRELLRAKIEAVAAGLVIFMFKKTAEVLFGPIIGNGLIDGRRLGGAPIFVMPGPYAARVEVDERLRQLAEAVSRETSEPV